MTSWAENHRLDLTIHKALEDQSNRLQTLSGRDKLALQQEFLEWSSMDYEDLEVDWMPHFNNWGREE